MPSRDEILATITPILQSAASPDHELSISGGAIATLAGLDVSTLFLGGKSEAERRAEAAESELADLKARLAKLEQSPAVVAPTPAPEPELPEPALDSTAPTPPAAAEVDELG
jgi:hypothetical protein